MVENLTDRLSALEADVVAAVDGQAAEEDLRHLVAQPSVTGSEEEVQDLVIDLLSEAGMSVARLDVDPAEIEADPDWPGAEMTRSTLPIVTGRTGTSGSRRVILAGHVDVVPAGDPDTWSADPWSGASVDGLLFGRGACDMKGGVAAIVAAVRALDQAGVTGLLQGELLAVTVPSEEDGGQGMLAAIRRGCRGDAAIIPEPTELQVVVAHAGALTFRLTVPGLAAHAAVRTSGVSALDNLQVILQALARDEQRRNAAEQDPLMVATGLPYPTIVGTVHGGVWASSVPDRMTAEGRYGVRLGQTWQEAAEELRSVVAEVCASDPFLQQHPAVVEVTGGRYSSAALPTGHGLGKGVADAAEAVLGSRPELVGVPYGADMRLLIHHADTPTVMFGPGTARLAHAADEFVPLGEVVDCARVLAVWALRQLA